MRLALLGEASLNTLPLIGQARQILAWLALQPQHTATRAKLARELWLDEDESQARRRLTKTLYRIKQDFPVLDDHLEADNHSMTLKNISLDVLEFEALLKSQNPKDWQQGFALYQGDLLEGEDAPWIEPWREHLRETYHLGLQRALEHAKSTNPNLAIQIAQRLVRYNPLSEEAHTELIRLYANANRREDAILQYATLEKTLLEELSSTPKPELRAYIQTLKHSLEGSEKPHHTLIGRNKELRMLAQQLEAAQVGHGGIIALQGEPGMGKTRLLDELEQLSRWHKIPMLRGTAKEQQSNAYAPLEQALQSQSILLEIATPLMRETLKPLLTEEANATASNSSSSAVGAALERWLGKLERPVLVVLDDLQWAGDLFWALLPVLTRITRQKAVLLVLSYRTYEIQTEPFAIEALNAMRQDNAVLPLEVKALTQDECAALAKATGKPLDAHELERLYRLSNGNPLVFLEFLGGEDNAERLDSLVQHRLTHLSHQARTALEAASVLGNNFSIEVWTAMLGQEAPIQELLEARFLTQAGENLMFQHDLIRSSIYQSLLEADKQKWHQRAMQELNSRGERRVVLAYHAENAGLMVDLVSFLRQAAEEALNLTSLKEARRLTNQALSKLNEAQLSDDFEKLKLRLIELELDNINNPSSKVLDEIKNLQFFVKKYGDLDLIYNVYRLNLNAIAIKGDVLEYNILMREFLDFFQERDLNLYIMAGIEVSEDLTGYFFQPENAREVIYEIQPIFEKNQFDDFVKMKMLCATIKCYQKLGRKNEVENLLIEAENLFKKSEKLVYFEPKILEMKSAFFSASGNIEEALALQKNSLEANKIIGNNSEVISLLNKIITSLDLLGNYEESILWAEEIIEKTVKSQSIHDLNKFSAYIAPFARIKALLGDFEQAETTLQPIRNWLLQGGMGDGAVEAWGAYGFIARQQADWQRAFQLFQSAFGVRPNSTYYLLLSAESASYAGMLPEALHCFAQVANVQHVLQKSHSLAQFFYVKFLIEKRASNLEEARFHVMNVAKKLQNPAYRNGVIFRFFTHKSIQEFWQQQNLTTITTELSRPDGIGTRQVTWTIDSGASDQAHFEQSGKVALRHHRLKRLSLEAAVQNATPTQEDFAQALGVTLRTIENDLATLRATGMEIRTLGMQKELVKK